MKWKIKVMFPNHQPDDDDDDDDHHHHLDFLGLTLPLFEINMVKSHLHPPGQNCYAKLLYIFKNGDFAWLC